MSVDSSEDGMERSIEQGLKSLQKMRNILEVSRYRQRRWYKLFTLKRVYRVVVTEKLSINDSGKYDDTQKKLRTLITSRERNLTTGNTERKETSLATC